MSEDYKDRFKSSLNNLVDSYLHHFEQVLPCESPIERMMAAALFFWSRLGGHEVGISAQKEIGDYRVDFFVTLIKNQDSASVIVECDGHDFHEKTKTQASRDKQRDRDLQKVGYHVLRFTGSDIWNEPLDCALEVIDFLAGLIKKSRPEGLQP